jgi:hypothetical protein
MSKLVGETVHAQLGPGPLQTGPDGLISQCIGHALYRPTTCVCASICVADVSNFNKPSVLADPRICPQIFSVTSLPDQVVIRGSVGLDS